ncbi:hypothetical protein [Phocaeicola sp.]
MNITLRNTQKGTLQSLSLKVMTDQMKQGKYITLIDKYQNRTGYGQHLPRLLHHPQLLGNPGVQ